MLAITARRAVYLSAGFSSLFIWAGSRAGIRNGRRSIFRSIRFLWGNEALFFKLIIIAGEG